jgi:hypothetical protein
MTNEKNIYWLVAPAGETLDLDAGRKFWKELIREGEWTNSRAGFTLKVDTDRLGAWKENFEAMLAAGIQVPVPWGHSYDPRDNAGFVEEIELRDGSLWGLLNVPDDDDAGKLGKTVRSVSVSINPSFTDGTGHEWGEVIEHVALTNYPVVVEQEDFMHAGDDGEGKAAIALELAAADSEAMSNDQAPITNEGKGDPSHSLRMTEETESDDTCHSERSEESLGLDDRAESTGDRDTEHTELETRDAKLSSRLVRLERERANRALDDAMRLGKFTRPVAEALRQLLDAGIAARYELDTAAEDAGTACCAPTIGDVAQVALDIIANTPPGAAVDLAEHTRVFAVPAPSGQGMTPARAEQIAKENRKLAGV